MAAIYFFDQIRQHITRGDLNAALLQLRDLLENAKELDEVILQQGQYSAIRKMIRLGIVSHPEATLEQNQIAAALLELMGELETQGAKPEFKAGLERAVSIVNNKNFMQESQLIQGPGSTAHFGDTYNINLGGRPAAETAKHDYNRVLFEALVRAISPYNDRAKNYSQDLSWLGRPKQRRVVQGILCSNFLGEIGKQLNKLMNIGWDQQMNPQEKQKHYLEKCQDIAHCCFDVVNYTLLSVWWDTVKKVTAYPLEPYENKILSEFFEGHFEQTLNSQFMLLKALCGIFKRYQIPFPFDDVLDTLMSHLDDGSLFEQACKNLEEVDENNFLTAETSLSDILKPFAFLTQYQLASIHSINYRQIRHGQQEYLHSYFALGMSEENGEGAKKGGWRALGEQTLAVLLYKGIDYQNGINLFPFVIDYNALKLEEMPKIYFFSARNPNDDNTLDYRFLDDKYPIPIKKQDVREYTKNLDHLVIKKELLIEYNFDCVVESFYDARKCITKSQND